MRWQAADEDLQPLDNPDQDDSSAQSTLALTGNDVGTLPNEIVFGAVTPTYTDDEKVIIGFFGKASTDIYGTIDIDGDVLQAGV